MSSHWETKEITSIFSKIAVEPVSAGKISAKLGIAALEQQEGLASLAVTDHAKYMAFKVAHINDQRTKLKKLTEELVADLLKTQMPQDDAIKHAVDGVSSVRKTFALIHKRYFPHEGKVADKKY